MRVPKSLQARLRRAEAARNSEEGRGGTESRDSHEKWALRVPPPKPSLVSTLAPSASTPSLSISDRNQLDHKNLPYSWRSVSSSNLIENEREETRKRFKRDGVRPHPNVRIDEKTETKQLLGDSSSVTKGQTATQVIRRRNPRPKVARSSPLAAILPGREASGDSTVLEEPTSPLPLKVTNPGFMGLNESVMPLEAFDDEKFETRSPTEWLENTREGKTPYYTNSGGNGGTWRWRACDIVSYDEISKRYNVVIQGLNPRKKAVKRLDLMFSTEDPKRFQKRVAAAREYRERFKEALRLRSFLEKTYDAKIHPMQASWLSQICRRAKALKPHSATAKRLLAEVEYRYDIAVKTASVYHRLLVFCEKEVEEQYMSLRLPDPPTRSPIPLLTTQRYAREFTGKFCFVRRGVV